MENNEQLLFGIRLLSGIFKKRNA